MRVLSWNADKVKNLTGPEIWLFIVARVLVGFGVGVLVTQYFPKTAGLLGLPALLIGLLLFVIAFMGFRRPKPI